jgi:hypothetical protein
LVIRQRLGRRLAAKQEIGRIAFGFAAVGLRPAAKMRANAVTTIAGIAACRYHCAWQGSQRAAQCNQRHRAQHKIKKAVQSHGAAHETITEQSWIINGSGR